jgi:peptidoglycan glycosyltransferase
MNKQIRRLGIFLILCYLALFVKLNQIQILQQEELTDNPLNKALVKREYNRPRGAITSADGALLAQSIDVDAGTKGGGDNNDSRRQRVYPEKDLFGHITGFFSLTYGDSGIEKQYSEELSATTVNQQIRGLQDLFDNTQTVGNVTVTVRKDLQQEARDALRDPITGAEREGSVVAVDPKTGAILAMWSYPSFDPNILSTGTYDQQKLSWDLLNLAPGNPLLAKAYQERYFPGSTFKVVTAGIGLESDKVHDDDPVYPTATSYLAKGTRTPISNFAGENCGGPLPQILAISCNSAFAEMGTETIGPETMTTGAASFGFNQDVPIDMPSPAQSSFPKTLVEKPDPPVLAQSSIGQRDVQATPLQMAMVAASVANKGVMMKPHLLKEVRDSNARVVVGETLEPWLTPMDESHAATLRNDMRGVITGGTGIPAQIPGVDVAGKTGTAQLGDGRVHTWMMAMAGPPNEDPQVAVAVVVLNQSAANSDNTGGQIAGPIARRVMQKALAVKAAAPVGPSTTVTPTTQAPLGGGTGNGGGAGQGGVTGPPSTPAKPKGSTP